jgi:hypothetical protein
MIRTITIYIALILFSVFTINAYWIGLNGQTTVNTFNRLPVLIAPANYVYLIWFVIIAVTFVYFMSYRENNQPMLFQTNLQTALFTCNALVHILVVYIWHEGQHMSAVILCGALLILTFSLYITYPLHPKTIKFRIPIALLFSWQLFLFVLMMNITLIHYEWSGFGLSLSLWSVIFLTVITLVSLHLKYHYEDWVSPLVMTWAFIGIAITNGLQDLLVTTASIFLSGVLIVGLYGFKKNREA